MKFVPYVVYISQAYCYFCKELRFKYGYGLQIRNNQEVHPDLTIIKFRLRVIFAGILKLVQKFSSTTDGAGRALWYYLTSWLKKDLN
jgi:hypothetical protein